MNLSAALLTWNLIGGSLFIGLPSGCTVSEVCVDYSHCVVPDNAQVVVIQWNGSPVSVIARVTWPDGSQGSMEAVPYPSFVG